MSKGADLVPGSSDVRSLLLLDARFPEWQPELERAAQGPSAVSGLRVFPRTPSNRNRGYTTVRRAHRMRSIGPASLPL